MTNTWRFSALVASLALGMLSSPQLRANICPTTAFTNTDCGYILTIGPGGSITGAPVAGANAYDGSEDSLIGVVNNSGAVYTGTIFLTGSGIFGFDADGICNFVSQPYCATAATRYEGPLNTFSNIKPGGDSGNVNITGLAAGATTYFSLEGPPGALNITLVLPNILTRYAANLNFGESYIDITNDGSNGAPPLGPGFGGAIGNICVNVYAFDASEELVSCCSCLVTPDQTVSLGVNRDLTSKTLTGVVPASVTVKLLATLAGTGGSGTGSVCNSSAATASPATLVNGVAAWGTTLHQSVAGTNDTTETPFTPSTLSSGELASIVGRCASIIGNASGFGQCASCRSGALGGTKF